jgi:hypothetical protein
MARKSTQIVAATKGDRRPLLEGQVRVSESGQFAVSMDALRDLPSFRRDVQNVAQIRQKLQSKR